jgi:hypothetical protein
VPDDSSPPQLSVVINILLGGSYLRRSIEALLQQRNPPRLEIIVPVCPAFDRVEDLQRQYPSVRFVEVDRLPAGADLSDPGLAHLVYDRRRAVGLGAARGEIVALTEDQMVPEAEWCAALVQAHRAPHPAIGGAIGNAGEGTLHRALFLSDFGRYEPPFEEGEAEYLTDQNVSYKRAALEKLRHVWSEFYHEPAVHDTFRAMGAKLWLTPECRVRMDRGPLGIAQQLRERFAWGRVFGGQRALRVSGASRMVLLGASPLIPVLIVWRRLAAAVHRGYSFSSLAGTLPALSAMAVWWAAGEAVGYLTARPFGSVGPASRPVRF